MKTQNCWTPLILIFLSLILISCDQASKSQDSSESALSVEEIGKSVKSPDKKHVEIDGVQPVLYTGEDKVLADNAPEGMVYIKGTCFTQGSDRAQTDEKFAHEVCLDGFYLDRHEMTQERWEAVMGYNPSKIIHPKLPVEQVNYYDIEKFIKKSDGACRLPTEAEWEYAAGSGVRTRYYWGNLMDDEFAWFEDNSEGVTHFPGEKKPNRFGLYDMSGNVWEWTNDWYESTYSPKKQNNPKGPEGGEYKVIRGGAMDSSAGALRITNRTWLHPKNRVFSKVTTYGGIVNEIFNYIGFRCARSLDAK